MFGGGLRVMSAFLAWDASNPLIELLALKIDLLLLFGLIGIYFANRAVVGVVGLLGSVFALSGIASIVGPDTKAFGIDSYQAGVAVISIGLAVFGLTLLRAPLMSRLAGLSWMLSFAAGLGGSMVGLAAEGFHMGGVLFGVGFVLGGLELV